uniref:Uncharacterized protein n=1 Tax=Triticum urartu TaxID=4572 RepID=A0A8R7PZM7_TRIUA
MPAISSAGSLLDVFYLLLAMFTLSAMGYLLGAVSLRQLFPCAASSRACIKSMGFRQAPVSSHATAHVLVF